MNLTRKSLAFASLIVGITTLFAPSVVAQTHTECPGETLQRFDREFANYCIYPDPTVPAGELKVIVRNLHPSDRADFEIWEKGSSGHSYRYLEILMLKVVR